MPRARRKKIMVRIRGQVFHGEMRDTTVRMVMRARETPAAMYA